MESTIDTSLVAKAIDLKSSLAKLRGLLNVDGESNVPQWCKDRMQELEDHLKEEKFIRTKQEESYDALSKYNKELTGQIDALAKSRDKLQEKFHRSEEALYLEKKLLENKETKWKQEKQQLELQYSQKQARIETLIARNAYYQKENEDFKNDHRRAKTIQKELDELKEEMSKKDAENGSLKKEMAEKEAANAENYKQEVQKRENLEKKLEETEAALNQELQEAKSSLEKAKEEMNGAAKSLASFLVVVKETIGDGGDEDNDDDDAIDLDLESNVSKIGVALENVQSIVADGQDETDELKRQLEELRQKWHESRGELMDLKEDYEIQEKRCAELEEQLEGLEPSTKSKRTTTNNDGDEEQSYDSRDEHEDEVEQTEKEQVRASQNDYDSDASDIVEVQPPSEGPAQEPQVEDEEPPGSNDGSKGEISSDIEEVEPVDTNSSKRPLEEEVEAADDTKEGIEGDEHAPTAKRVKIDEESAGEGSSQTMRNDVHNLKEDAASAIAELQPVDTSATKRVVEDEEVEVVNGNSNEGEQEEVPIAKRAKVDEDSDSDRSGYGSF